MESTTGTFRNPKSPPKQNRLRLHSLAVCFHSCQPECASQSDKPRQSTSRPPSTTRFQGSNPVEASPKIQSPQSMATATLDFGPQRTQARDPQQPCLPCASCESRNPRAPSAKDERIGGVPRLSVLASLCAGARVRPSLRKRLGRRILGFGLDMKGLA